VGIVSTTDLLDKICEQDELMGYRVMPLDYGVRSHAATEATPESSRDWGARVYADGWIPDSDPASLDAERFVQKRLDEEGHSWEEDDDFREDENVHWT
jgi:hypothetical protein